MTLDEIRQGMTPGPWRVGDAGLTVFGPKCDVPSPETIAPCKKRADAAAIAMVPALLDAVEVLRQVVADRDATADEFWGRPTQIRNSTIDAARAALAKLAGPI